MPEHYPRSAATISSERNPTCLPLDHLDDKDLLMKVEETLKDALSSSVFLYKAPRIYIDPESLKEAQKDGIVCFCIAIFVQNPY